VICTKKCCIAHVLHFFNTQNMVFLISLLYFCIQNKARQNND
jgi:hypothetical protein